MHGALTKCKSCTGRPPWTPSVPCRVPGGATAQSPASIPSPAPRPQNRPPRSSTRYPDESSHAVRQHPSARCHARRSAAYRHPANRLPPRCRGKPARSDPATREWRSREFRPNFAAAGCARSRQISGHYRPAVPRTPRWRSASHGSAHAPWHRATAPARRPARSGRRGCQMSDRSCPSPRPAAKDSYHGPRNRLRRLACSGKIGQHD